MIWLIKFKSQFSLHCSEWNILWENDWSSVGARLRYYWERNKSFDSENKPLIIRDNLMLSVFRCKCFSSTSCHSFFDVKLDKSRLEYFEKLWNGILVIFDTGCSVFVLQMGNCELWLFLEARNCIPRAMATGRIKLQIIFSAKAFRPEFVRNLQQIQAWKVSLWINLIKHLPDKKLQTCRWIRVPSTSRFDYGSKAGQATHSKRFWVLPRSPCDHHRRYRSNVWKIVNGNDRSKMEGYARNSQPSFHRK